MRTLTLLCLVPCSHILFELLDFLEFSEFLRTVLVFFSSTGNGSNHRNQYLTQLEKMVDMTVKYRLPDIVAFSSTCFADTDLYQLQSSREFYYSSC